MMREEEWIEAARQGDQDAFAELVRLYEKRVFALTSRMCRNPEDAAEAAQEAFLSAWQGLRFCIFILSGQLHAALPSLWSELWSSLNETRG